ncbi:hypothetical protein HW130_17975 [Streptomyces sp. PKU-EA00015]|uniref:hypothetical protein n=1 Tax=Streptomyces sp. PKU-EA00015 TaxID=2748326 RepID=UPI0015A1506B|nr:hypothetical protein [Streptomyces sp. PKU-EA00015]NWF28132.1 hypothetical protein [Streptomyces sp. PKU-EA00015]
MLLEALGSVLIGLALSWAATRHLAERLPSRRAVFTTGTLGAMFGAYVTHVALGPGHELVTLIGSAAIGTVLLSLLLRPSTRRLHRAFPF